RNAVRPINAMRRRAPRIWGRTIEPECSRQRPCSVRPFATTRRSGYEIKRIRQLERPLGVQSDQVALLIAEVGDDGLAELLDLDALVGLVGGYRWFGRARGRRGTQIQVVVGRAREAGLLQVSERPFPRRLQQGRVALVVRGVADLLRHVLVAFVPSAHEVDVDLGAWRSNIDTP